MSDKLAANTIHVATILKAMKNLEDRGVEITTSYIGEELMKPKKYDLGSRLFNMCKAATPLVAKHSDGYNNTYSITEAGLKYLQANFAKVQVFGEYDAIGKDKPVKVQASAAALNALTELQGLIDKNTKLRQSIIGLYNVVDATIKEISDGE